MLVLQRCRVCVPWSVLCAIEHSAVGSNLTICSSRTIAPAFSCLWFSINKRKMVCARQPGGHTMATIDAPVDADVNLKLWTKYHVHTRFVALAIFSGGPDWCRCQRIDLIELTHTAHTHAGEWDWIRWARRRHHDRHKVSFHLRGLRFAGHDKAHRYVVCVRE